MSEHKDFLNLQPPAGEISWTQNTLILDRCTEPLQCEFHPCAGARFDWTRRVVDHQIDNQRYEKCRLNQARFDQALPPAVAAQTRLAVKDPDTFDFLGPGDAHEEREAQAGLVAQIRSFLTEMVPYFAFAGTPYRLTVKDNNYCPGLLRHPRALKSLIAVELKIGEFQSEHKGKREFYRVALNEEMKRDGENDAIGIIACKGKKRTAVEYALKSTTLPIGVAAYGLTARLPEAYRKLLPRGDEIVARLASWKQEE